VQAEIATLQRKLDDLKLEVECSAQSTSTSITADKVRVVLRARREREVIFGQDLFADPAWDILLDLYAAQLEQRRVATSELCCAAAVPATTALRWIEKLQRTHLIVRTADPLDGRRVFVELSERGAAAMHDFFVRFLPLGIS
jgi:DNA-binding MarR family transcriptional regulator